MNFEKRPPAEKGPSAENSQEKKPVLHDSKLAKDQQEFIFNLLPRDRKQTKVRVFLESIPEKDRPGMSYLAILKFSDGKWGTADALFGGMRSTSKIIKGKKPDNKSGRAIVHIFDTYSEAVAPLSLTDEMRRRLGFEPLSVKPYVGPPHKSVGRE